MIDIFLNNHLHFYGIKDYNNLYSNNQQTKYSNLNTIGKRKHHKISNYVPTR